MTYLFAILGGLAGALVAFFVGALGASILASVMNITSREGASGYFAVAGGLLLGAIGLVVGIVWTLKSRGYSGFGPLALHTAGSIVSVAGVVGLGIWLYWEMQPHLLNRNGPTPLLEFQVRSEAGQTLPARELVEVELQTSENRMPGVIPADWAKEADGRPVLSGYVQMYHRTADRTLVLSLPEGKRQIFRVKLPANAMQQKFRTWSQWYKADLVDPAGPALQVRYQVETYEQ